MKQKNGVIVASHGYFAKEAINSVKMISGDINPDVVRVYSMTLGLDLDRVVEDIKSEILSLSEYVENIYLFADLMGGTPSNASITNLLNHGDLNITVVNGFNLSLLLSTILNIENDFNIDDLLGEAKSAMVKVNNNSDDEGGQL